MYTNHNREQLRTFMARHDLAADDVAEILGVEPQTVRNWSSKGPRSIPWAQLIKLDEAVYQRRLADWQPLNEAPVIKCRVIEDDQGQAIYSFWCDYCRKEHSHGAPEGGRIHRAAHCGGGRMVLSSWTPYRDHGYWLEPQA